MADDDKQTKKEQKRAEREAKRAEREAKKEAKAAEGGGSPIAGIRQWVIDSYNGIFKIVVQPLLPKPRVLGFIVIAFVIGLFWAYLIRPTTFFNAAPNQLSEGQREQYVILVAGSRQANLYSPEATVQLLSRVEDPSGTVQNLIAETDGNIQAALQELLPLAQQADPGTGAPSSSGFFSSIFWFIMALIFIVLVVNLFAILWGLLIGGFVDQAINAIKPKTEEQKRFAEERAAIKKQRVREEELKKQMAAEAPNELGPPITQKVSIYTKGRGYDDSFAIEDADDMFLGETGATIAKAIGDSQELSAIEFWLFDKEDFVRTLTKIFASEHAFNDPAIRSELEPKVEDPANDIVLLKMGSVAVLETDQLRVEAKVIELVEGNVAGLPPNSHYSDVTLQVQGWEKKAGGDSGGGTPAPAPVPTSAPAAASGLPDMSAYEIGPPPPMPGQDTATASSPPPAQPVDYNPAPPPPANAGSGGLPDLSSYEIGPPPPMPGQSDDEEEDDPFGGTGDFTPLGRT